MDMIETTNLKVDFTTGTAVHVVFYSTLLRVGVMDPLATAKFHSILTITSAYPPYKERKLPHRCKKMPMNNMKPISIFTSTKVIRRNKSAADMIYMAM